MSDLRLKPKPFAPKPMKTHTPGPWHVVFHHPKLVKVETARVVICDSFGGLSDETMANTRLIASAPEMLAALELIYSNAGESPEWIRARIGPVIEKAIGESESLARKIREKGNQ